MTEKKGKVQAAANAKRVTKKKGEEPKLEKTRTLTAYGVKRFMERRKLPKK